VYNNKKETLDVMDMDANNTLAGSTKGARATVIVQCAGIWISTTGFGISWKAVQIRLVPPTTIKEHAFIEDADQDAEESDIEEEAGGEKPAEQQAERQQPTSVEDQEMLDDEEDELDPPTKK